MVATTQKWNLPVEELGDPSDMPSASGRLTRAIEAALDRLQTSLSTLISQSVAGRVAKTGDTMSGPLDGVTQLSVAGRVKAGYDLMTGSFSWLSESGELRLVRWSPNLQQAESFPITVNYATGDTSVQHGATFNGQAVFNQGVHFKDNVYMNKVPAAPAGAQPGTFRLLGIRPGGDALEWMSGMRVTTGNVSGGDSGMASSRRLKTGITPARMSGVGLAGRLSPVNYVWREEARPAGDVGGVRLGLIAEDVAEVVPEAATFDDQGRVAGLDPLALVAVLVQAVQELSARVDALEGGA